MLSNLALPKVGGSTLNYHTKKSLHFTGNINWIWFRYLTYLIAIYSCFLSQLYVIAVVLTVPDLWIRNLSFCEITIYQQKTNIWLLIVVFAMLMLNAGLELKIFHLKIFWKIYIAGWVGCEYSYPHRLYFWHNHFNLSGFNSPPLGAKAGWKPAAWRAVLIPRCLLRGALL